MHARQVEDYTMKIINDVLSTLNYDTPAREVRQ